MAAVCCERCEMRCVSVDDMCLLLCGVYCLLLVVCCALCCLLYGVYCMLFGVCGLLSVVCCSENVSVA